MSIYHTRQIWAVRAFGWQVDIRWNGWLPLSVRQGRNDGFGRVIRLGRRAVMVVGRLP